MTASTTYHQDLINECIAYNEAELAAADPQDRHFWDGWDREKIQSGEPVVYVTRTAPGLGHTSIFVAHIMIEMQDGTYASIGDGTVERVPTRKAAWKNGLEGYANRLAATVGPGLRVIYKAL